MKCIALDVVSWPAKRNMKELAIASCLVSIFFESSVESS